VEMEDRLRDYVVELGRRTRADERVEVGVSPRGIQKLFEASRAVAVLDGRDYVVPEDVKRIAVPALQHRLVLTAEANVRGVDRREVVRDVVDRIEVPAVAD